MRTASSASMSCILACICLAAPVHPVPAPRPLATHYLNAGLHHSPEPYTAQAVASLFACRATTAPAQALLHPAITACSPCHAKAAPQSSRHADCAHGACSCSVALTWQGGDAADASSPCGLLAVAFRSTPIISPTIIIFNGVNWTSVERAITNPDAAVHPHPRPCGRGVLTPYAPCVYTQRFNLEIPLFQFIMKVSLCQHMSLRA